MVSIQIALGLLSALQLGVGLVGQLVVMRIVGIGWQTDAYIAAQAIPMILMAVVAASLQSLWLPRFGHAADSESSSSSELAIAQGQTLKVMLFLILLFWASSEVWVPVAFPGFSDLQRDFVVHISAPLFVAAGFNSLSGIFIAALRARDRFIVPEALSLATLLVSLVGILLLVPYYGVTAAAWISAVRGLFLLLMLQFVVRSPCFRLRASDSSREIAEQAVTLIGGSFFIKSGPLVDRHLGSHASGGEITILSVAQLAMNSVASILERALLAHILPSFAKRLKKGGTHELMLAYKACLWRILFAVLAVGTGLVILRPIWDVTCEHLLGMSHSAAWQFWLICASLLPSLFVSIAGSAAVAVFYAFGEARLPTLIGLLGFALSLLMKSILFYRYGVIGISIGASCYLIFNMILYHFAVVWRLTPKSV
jgi:peptidoglycan biosynthesis protein MviN/MurJ (putative lipid II flippase)